jgi:hypothetical protein
MGASLFVVHAPVISGEDDVERKKWGEGMVLGINPRG